MTLETFRAVNFALLAQMKIVILPADDPLCGKIFPSKKEVYLSEAEHKAFLAMHTARDLRVNLSQK